MKAKPGCLHQPGVTPVFARRIAFPYTYKSIQRTPVTPAVNGLEAGRKGRISRTLDYAIKMAGQAKILKANYT